MTIYGVSNGGKVHVIDDGSTKARCKTEPVPGFWRLYSRSASAMADPRAPRRCRVCFDLQDGERIDWERCDDPAVLRGFIRALLIVNKRLSRSPGPWSDPWA